MRSPLSPALNSCASPTSSSPRRRTPSSSCGLRSRNLHLRKDIEADPVLATTEKESLVLARRGQGLFKQRVQSIETHCRVIEIGGRSK